MNRRSPTPKKPSRSAKSEPSKARGNAVPPRANTNAKAGGREGTKSRGAGTGPRPSRTREEAKQQSRDALVRAALELFAEQGIDIPSLDAICDRAGYTRGAFYVHFEDREELLVAVMNHVGETFLASVFADLSAMAGESLSTKDSQLQRLANRFLDGVRAGTYPLMASPGKAPLIRPHQLLDACARSTIVRERYRGLVETSSSGVGALFAMDQQNGLARTDLDAELAGQMTVALVIGAQTMLELGVPLNADVMGQLLQKLLLT